MDKDYYTYLTKKLDQGKSGNPIVKEAEERIKLMLKKKPTVRFIDAGCFSGAVAHRVYLNLPPKLRERVRFVGVDNNIKVLEKGRSSYPEVTFIQADLRKSFPLISQYDVVVLSNTLHEIYSDEFQKSKRVLNSFSAVKSAIAKTSSLLNKNGYLIILDGLKPTSSSKNIAVEFTNKISSVRFLEFAKQYKAFPIKIEKLSDKKIMTNLCSLAAFLTKARYLNKSYWKKESLEIYQFFNTQDFKRAITAQKMKIIKFEPQKFPKIKIEEQIKSIKPTVEVPTKNVLIVARRV